MPPAANSRNKFAGVLAFALACCIVLFLVQVVVHGHEKNHNESACRVCHAAHLGLVPALSTLLIDAPLLASGPLHQIDIKFHKELFSHDAPSRAPPAA